MFPNVQNMPPNPLTTPSYNTKLLPTTSNLTYINSSASISEPIKPFDGLDENDTPVKYLHVLKHVLFSP